MGIFATWQPRYARQGVATFPLLIDDKAKKPAVKGYAKTGLNGSEQLAMKFPDVDAFAFMAGKRSGVTVIDIDSQDDEDLLREVLHRYGDTPLISRTGSGGFHCYYRHGNEGRRVRPDPDTPVDHLGGGVLAAPPSQGSRGAYTFIRGSVADLGRLPFIRGGADRAEVKASVQRELVKAGGRNKALMDYLRGQARYTDDLAGLIDAAKTYADDQIDRATGHPFTDAEIEAVARSVWEWTEKKIGSGEYFVGEGRRMIIGHDDLDAVIAMGPDPLALFMHLKRHFGGMASFYIANEMSEHMPCGGWARKRFAQARAALVGGGMISEKRKASSFHGPAIYAWSKGGRI